MVTTVITFTFPLQIHHRNHFSFGWKRYNVCKQQSQIWKYFNCQWQLLTPLWHSRPSKTRPSGFLPFTQWKFSLPGTVEIFKFTRSVCDLSGATLTYPAYIIWICLKRAKQRPDSKGQPGGKFADPVTFFSAKTRWEYRCHWVCYRGVVFSTNKKKMKGVFSKRRYDAEPLWKWHTKICLSEWIRFKFLSWKDDETNVWYRVGGSAKHEKVLSARGLVLCFFGPRAWKQPVWRSLRLIFTCFQGKKFWDYTLDEDDVKTIFDELELQDSPLKISFSWWRFFLKISLPTSGRRRVSRLRYISRTTKDTDYDQANKFLLVFVFVLWSKALHFLRHFAPIQTSVPNDVLSSEKATVFSSYSLLTWWHRTYQQGQGTGLGKRQRTQKTPSIHPNEPRSLILVARASLFSASCTRLDRSL